MYGACESPQQGISIVHEFCGGAYPRCRTALNRRRALKPAPLVLVAGGASGVGLACARILAARGARLILCDCDGSALLRAGQELDADTHYCDVISESSVAIVAEDVLERFRSVDVLINAAGDGDVRTLGMMRMALALLPQMRRNKMPRLILNVAPDFGPREQGEALFPNIASPRNFRRLSASLAVQARGSAVRVITIMPRRAIGEPVGGAIGTKCDDGDVVAAVMSAIFGKAAVGAADRSKPPSAAPAAVKRTG